MSTRGAPGGCDHGLPGRALHPELAAVDLAGMSGSTRAETKSKRSGGGDVANTSASAATSTNTTSVTNDVANTNTIAFQPTITVNNDRGGGEPADGSGVPDEHPGAAVNRGDGGDDANGASEASGAAPAREDPAPTRWCPCWFSTKPLFKATKIAPPPLHSPPSGCEAGVLQVMGPCVCLLA